MKQVAEAVNVLNQVLACNNRLCSYHHRSINTYLFVLLSGMQFTFLQLATLMRSQRQSKGTLRLDQVVT